MTSRLTVVGGGDGQRPNAYGRGYKAGYDDAMGDLQEAARGFGIGLFVALVFGVAIGFVAGVIWMGSA